VIQGEEVSELEVAPGPEVEEVAEEVAEVVAAGEIHPHHRVLIHL